jgi:hypothetical protein
MKCTQRAQQDRNTPLSERSRWQCMPFQTFWPQSLFPVGSVASQTFCKRKSASETNKRKYTIFSCMFFSPQCVCVCVCVRAREHAPFHARCYPRTAAGYSAWSPSGPRRVLPLVAHSRGQFSPGAVFEPVLLAGHLSPPLPSPCRASPKQVHIHRVQMIRMYTESVRMRERERERERGEDVNTARQRGRQREGQRSGGRGGERERARARNRE